MRARLCTNAGSREGGAQLVHTPGTHQLVHGWCTHQRRGHNTYRQPQSVTPLAHLWASRIPYIHEYTPRENVTEDRGERRPPPTKSPADSALIQEVVGCIEAINS